VLCTTSSATMRPTRRSTSCARRSAAARRSDFRIRSSAWSARGTRHRTTGEAAAVLLRAAEASVARHGLGKMLGPVAVQARRSRLPRGRPRFAAAGPVAVQPVVLPAARGGGGPRELSEARRLTNRSAEAAGHREGRAGSEFATDDSVDREFDHASAPTSQLLERDGSARSLGQSLSSFGGSETKMSTPFGWPKMKSPGNGTATASVTSAATARRCQCGFAATGPSTRT
jgi:hypothetical protein